MANYGDRPTDITPEMISKWTVECDTYSKESYCPYNQTDKRELFYAGEYLHMKVVELGATIQIAKDLSFKLGRMAWPRCNNLWEYVNSLINQFKLKIGS